MARMASREPTDGELEILQALWELGPAEIGAIRAAIEKRRPVALTTVATMLKVMLQKDLVDRRDGARAYLWSAKVQRREVANGFLRRLADRLFDGSAKSLVAHLVEGGALSAGDRAEIRRLFDAAQATPDSARKEKR